MARDYCWTLKTIGCRRCLKDERPNNSGREIARVLRRDGSRTFHERGKSNRKKCPPDRKSNSFSLDGVIPFPLLLMWSPVTLIKIEFVGGGRVRPLRKLKTKTNKITRLSVMTGGRSGKRNTGTTREAGVPKQRRKHESLINESSAMNVRFSIARGCEAAIVLIDSKEKMKEGSKRNLETVKHGCNETIEQVCKLFGDRDAPLGQTFNFSQRKKKKKTTERLV